MGLEFRLRVSGGDWPPAVVPPETFLRRLPELACLAPRALLATQTSYGTELREPRNTSGMPDVVVAIEERGFYILDNNSELANLVLAEAMRYLLASCERVTIEEP